MDLARKFHRFQKACTGLFVLFSIGFLFFNTTRILQDRNGAATQDDVWAQSSLLYNTKYQEKKWNLNDQVFGNHRVNRDSYNQFLSIQSQYDAQKNFGTVNAYTEQMYYLEMTSLSQKTFDLVQRNQAENIRESLSLAAAQEYINNPDYSFLKTPAAVVGALGAFYTGRMIRLKLNDDWRLSLQNGGGNQSKVGLLSLSTDGFSGAANKDRDGQYHLIFNKRLVGNTGATSGYTTSTQASTVGFTHALSEGWTVQYDRTISGTEKNQDLVHLNYSQGF